MSTPLLTIERVSHRYDTRVLFTDLSWAAGPGCFALDAESGTGKSTLLRILAGQAEPGGGEVTVAGHSLSNAPDVARAALSFIPEDFAEYPAQSGRAFLAGVAASRQVALGADTMALADAFGLTPHLDKRFDQMSFGTRKKTFFTATALGQVRVILADEPTSGLDGPSRRVLADFFRHKGTSSLVLFTSYDADFVQTTAARLIRFSDMQQA
ncbi:ATP-binding cassette domain-containing protein [Achromobacter sp. GG226]|uniref:ABC transporter ATP-binding protein n=1 Tax=Verticiella alkaliphila TaxID=2779529 RepID=UPI001C0E2392|nr:ATP-binding cassette domain-containing protein [Verticiella sp. GG226]MBU4609578.1 ATP-binding cassette domain-containing protein [Verticiella sp. GG226]